MKVAIASNDKNEGSMISDFGGRAPYYLIFENKKLVKSIHNPFRVGGGGAGFSVAEMLGDEKVDLVIIGKIGGNMKSALDSKEIQYREMSNMSVKEALEKI